MSLTVTTDAFGVPQAHVSSEHLWDLVEFLSYQRHDVGYTYNASSFVVTFRRMDVDAVHKMLAEWQRSRELVAV